MSIVPDHHSAKETDAKSSVSLHSENVAQVFFELVKNRLQHVNSWSVIGNELSATFQLTNKDGIEVYRKANANDFIKIFSHDGDSQSPISLDWFRVELLSDLSDSDGLESFGFRLSKSDNPGHTKMHGNSFGNSDAASVFLVERVGMTVRASIAVTQNHMTNVGDASTVSAVAMIRFSHIQWQNLTDGLISR